MRTAAVVLVLALALALAHGPTWLAGAARVIAYDEIEGPNGDLARADAIFEAWLGGRNALTLLSTPWRLFETEHCAPMARSLTLGIPMIALGVLGMPAALATSNPILVYNAALVLQSAVMALGMLLLASRWTRSRTAGLVAALLFAFHPIRLGHITHPTVWDMSFTLFALFFAERLFSQGRWRDAVGLAAAIALQVATDFYPLVAASLMASPFALWLWLRRVPRRASALQLALPPLVGLAAIWLLLGPYLQARSAGTLFQYKSGFIYAEWYRYAPGETLFFGWTALALALLGAIAPRAGALPGPGGDPRGPLLAGAALALLVAAGPDTGAQLGRIAPFAAGFDPHALLASVLPGLSSVRGAERLSIAALCVTCLLAGVGSAWLLARAGRRRDVVAGALVTVALVAGFGLPFGWLAPGHRWQLVEIHPDDAQIAFFRELAIMGDSGPLFEVPIDSLHDTSVLSAPRRILLSSWHGRRTSACYGSADPPQRAALVDLAARLPERAALRELRAQGFTTLLVHHPVGAARAVPLLRPFERATRGNAPSLWLLHRIDSISAYAIVAEAAD